MNDNNLIILAIFSSLATCGLLIPVWAIVCIIYFIVKTLTKNKPEEIQIQPEVILPDNSFADDWTFIIKETTYDNEDEASQSHTRSCS